MQTWPNFRQETKYNCKNNLNANRVRFTWNLPGDQIRSEESELIGR